MISMLSFRCRWFELAHISLKYPTNKVQGDGDVSARARGQPWWRRNEPPPPAFSRPPTDNAKRLESTERVATKGLRGGFIKNGVGPFRLVFRLRCSRIVPRSVQAAGSAGLQHASPLQSSFEVDRQHTDGCVSVVPNPRFYSDAGANRHNVERMPMRRATMRPFGSQAMLA